jgi:fatty acid desaturase
LFHGLLLVGYAAAFWIYLHPERAHIHGWASMAAFVAASTVMLGWVSGIDVPVNFHNHAHKPVFTIEWLNRWAGRLWTFSGGWPSFFFEHAHVTVHHAKLLGRHDWTLPYRLPDGRFESQARYSFLHWPWRFGYHFYRDFTGRDQPRGLGGKAWRELLIFAAFWSIPFWINVKMAILLWVLPQWFGNIMISGAGMYLQHAGCVVKSDENPYSHSNSSLSPVLNLTMFNVGFHTHHHEHPQVHWTQLPRLHQHIKQKLQARRGRIFSVGYHSMSSTLARSWLGSGQREARLPRHPEFGGDAVCGEPFELARPRDYRLRHGLPEDVVP